MSHAYAYFGGVTRLLIPDNLKTGVTKNTRYETVLNRSYQELAEHYDTAIVPARVEHPRDKSHAEGTVRLASTWILAALRNEHFFSLSEAQEAVKDKLEEMNQKPFQAPKTGCRRSVYLEEERDFMKPLPAVPYELSTWMPNMSVSTDYLISDGRNKYSVPFDLMIETLEHSSSPRDKRIGQAVKSCLTKGVITVDDYAVLGLSSRWNVDMSLAETMGLVQQVSSQCYRIQREMKPTASLLSRGQRKFIRAVYDSFGDETFSVEMVVATLEYSDSYVSAYLHQFSLLKVLDCRKEDVLQYQFLVTPEERPEFFDPAA